MSSDLKTRMSVVLTKWGSSLILALRSLWLHKLRSFLSVFGIIIGTAAVISIMAFGKGSMEDALEEIRRQGTTNVIVKSVKPLESSSTQRASWVAVFGLTWDDYDRFKMIDTVVGQVPMRVFPQEIRRFEHVFNAELVATTEDYAKINRFEMAAGRFLVDGDDQNDEGDAQRFRNVVVLGSRVAEELFPFEDPIGQSVVINRAQYVVVGVIKERLPRSSGSGGASENFNKQVYIPIRTARVRFGERVIIRQGGSRTGEQVELHQITLTVADINQVRGTGEAVSDLLKRNHAKNDWEVFVPLDRLKEAEDTRFRFMMLLAIIGFISLFVGGIGIMNIMLATVTERTREIGIRRALGAKRRDITVQFIIEAVVQTTIGGVLGIVTGTLATLSIPVLVGLFVRKPLPVQFEPYSFILSLGVAVGTGVVFGWYPAWRASHLDPIEALRHT